ncbi:Triacylglycerol lipase, partial [Trichostrongylus colubriformis]
AILGGSCVDTKELLGPPLTDLIDTFVSVAGVNHGSNLCALFPGTKLCNLVNGLSCNSKYIQDINAKPRYEGRYIFSIYSQQDEIVGYRSSCGDVTASVTGADEEFLRPGNHAQVMENTIDLQANLIGAH